VVGWVPPRSVAGSRSEAAGVAAPPSVRLARPSVEPGERLLAWGPEQPLLVAAALVGWWVELDLDQVVAVA